MDTPANACRCVSCVSDRAKGRPIFVAYWKLPEPRYRNPHAPPGPWWRAYLPDNAQSRHGWSAHREDAARIGPTHAEWIGKNCFTIEAA